MTVKSLETVFNAHFRAVADDEEAELRARFATFLNPVYLAFDRTVLVAQNRLPASKSLAIDVLSALYTDTNNFAIKYIGITESPRDHAGAGSATPEWLELADAAAMREAALHAWLRAGDEIAAHRRWIEDGRKNIGIVTASGARGEIL